MLHHNFMHIFHIWLWIRASNPRFRQRRVGRVRFRLPRYFGSCKDQLGLPNYEQQNFQKLINIANAEQSESKQWHSSNILFWANTPNTFFKWNTVGIPASLVRTAPNTSLDALASQFSLIWGLTISLLILRVMDLLLIRCSVICNRSSY